MTDHRPPTTDQAPTVCGYPAADVYTDQDGVVWLRSCATCPRCAAPTEFDNRVRGSGYFRCDACGVLYDEPTFEPAEFAFAGTLDDDGVD